MAPSPTKPAFSLVEAVIACAVLALLVTAFTGGFTLFDRAQNQAVSRYRAALVAEEGLEATRSIRDNSFGQLTDGPHGLAQAGNVWTFNSNSDTADGYQRVVTVSSIDATTKNILSTVTWSAGGRIQTYSAETRLTNWRLPTQQPTTTALTTSPNPSTYGTTVTLTATISPSVATGTVTFKNGINTIGSSAVVGGIATMTISNLAVGSHSLTADYSGAVSYLPSISAVVTQVVNQNAAAVVLVTNPNPSAPSQIITLTATINPTSATGTVTFKEGAATLGTGSVTAGVATMTTSSLSVGTHSLTAVYGGDTNNAIATSAAVNQVVQKITTTTTLTSDINPAVVSQTITLTATIAPAGATGTVTFKEGAATLGTGAVSGGTATMNTSSLTAGSHNLTAEYAGDATYLGSTSTVLTQVVSSAKGGMLVYADGGTTSDVMRYRVLDGTTGTWSAIAQTADVDASTNRAARVIKVYSSTTRDEKIVLSRHYNGSTQYIYGQVWDGSAWGHVQLLTSWSSTTNLDVENFDGAYQEINGNFTAVYSDNSNTPKYRTWNGSTWSGQVSVSAAILGTPNYVVLKTRPGTNEMMLAILDSASDTRTAYYSGSAWDAAFASRATNAQSNTTRLVDFDWSLNNPLLGELVFSDKSNDKSPATMLFTANGLGAVTAGVKVNVGGAQANNVGSFTLTARNGTTEWEFCNKDTAGTPVIRCSHIDATGAISVATTLTSVTSNGVQRSFDIEYESQTNGDYLVAVYSDSTTTPKMKKYNPVTSTWDVSATSLSPLGNSVRSVHSIADSYSNDILYLLADNNLDLWTIVWDGASNNMYTTPVGKAFSAQGTNGSATTNFWYDYAWDRF